MIRYQLGAPAIFSWQSAQHKRMQGEGVTRDISPLGAFVFTPTCPPVEATIQIEVLLPPLTQAKATTRIKAEGRVLRVEPNHEKGVAGGFAVLSKGFELGHAAPDKTEFPVADIKKLLELRSSDE